MSEYKRIKARALEIQREKEYELKRELARKAELDKKKAQEEEERRKRNEAAQKEARRIELMRANDALNNASKKPTGPSDGYDPFAEDAFAGPSRPQPRATPKSGGMKAAGNGNATRATATTSKPRAPSSGSKAKEPAALGRKEKAALKLQRESKGRAGDADSLFSVHALVNGLDSRGGSAGPGSGTASPRRPPPARTSSAPPRSTAAAKSNVGASSTSASTQKKTMSQLKKGVDVKQLRPLCPDRNTRDRRTMDEIQRDIRVRKGLPPLGGTGSGSSTPRGGDRDRDRDRDRPVSRGSAPRPRDSDRGRDDRDRDRGRDDRSRDRRDDRGRDRERERRRRSPSSEYESDSPPRKRSRASPVGEPSRSAVSSIIQSIFSRPGSAPRRYDDDSGSDMEAGLSDVEMEEKRALRIARKEDELAEREENARREAKEKAKRAAMRK